MTNKQKSIVACHLQTEKYRNAKLGEKFFSMEVCFLCKIHIPKPGGLLGKKCCKGCPLAQKEAGVGCLDFVTFNNAREEFGCLKGAEIFPSDPSIKLLNALEQRAKFYDWLAVELEKYPASQFTKKGWKDFEIDKNL